jgi:hypothetical protein
MRMMASYAKGFLEGRGHAGHWQTVSCHDDFLVIEDLETYHYQSASFLGTKLIDGKLQVDEQGYVTFRHVQAVIDENTRWKF